jgi:hypothetical protein
VPRTSDGSVGESPATSVPRGGACIESARFSRPAPVRAHSFVTSCARARYRDIQSLTESKVTTPGTSVTGGEKNLAEGVTGSIGGGYENKDSKLQSSVSGGAHKAGGDYSSVFGGLSNEAIGEFSWVGGGEANKAKGNSSSILGLDTKEASGEGEVLY